MKAFHVCVLLVAVAQPRVSATGHHDDTFYEDYVVGGHSHPRSEPVTESVHFEKPGSSAESRLADQHQRLHDHGVRHKHGVNAEVDHSHGYSDESD